MVKYKVYLSDSYDPRVNLSLEEHLMKTVKNDERILLFWQSKNAVVIGINQNPYQECNLVNIEKDDVIMVRRLSGGGAVYHDLGNLNFAFISRSQNFSIEHNFDTILKALERLGISGEFNGRNDLVTLGRKFSGNAFIHDEDCHLHHGTLLLEADMTKLSDYLRVSHKKLDNKGFDSIKSRVINLSEVNPTITSETVIQSVITKLKTDEIFDSFEHVKSSDMISEISKEKYMSHQWNFGECAAFEIKAEEKFKWGLVSLEMNINNGDIDYINIRTDALDYGLFVKLNAAFKNKQLTEKTVNELIISVCDDCMVRKDLIELFKINIFS